MGVTLGHRGGFVTDKGSCRHNVGTVRHKDRCHRMAEGVGVQVGKIRVFLLQLVPHAVQILCNVVRIHRSTVLIGKQVAAFLPEIPVQIRLFAAPL